MRLSDFRTRVAHAFGDVRGPSMLRDHVLPQLGSRTPDEALADGVDARDVWEALCDDLRLADELRWGPDVP